MNGDGRDELIVGAHFYNGGQPGEGAAFVVPEPGMFASLMAGIAALLALRRLRSAVLR